MREVDEALSRAYARRAGSEHPAVPPAPDVNRPPGLSDPDEPGPSAVTLRWPSTVLTLERDFGDRFARTADALLDARDRRQGKVFLFTSCHRAEGRTTLVLALSRALARKPGRTLLVDADLAGPMLARSLDLRPAVGLEDVVDGGHALADALVDAPDDHLTLLPLRGAVADPRGFLTGPSWSCTSARLRREFDIVLLDGGPLFTGLGTEAPPLGVDAAVLVLNRALTGERALLRARDALAAAGIPLLGLAETFAG